MASPDPFGGPSSPPPIRPPPRLQPALVQFLSRVARLQHQRRTDARRLAESLGCPFLELSIEGIVERYTELLAPVFADRAPDLTEENLQARIRGTALMALSNKFGWLVLTTGNKSEMATGYSTLYGDMAGGFAVIKDVPKVLVFALCEDLNARERREVMLEHQTIVLKKVLHTTVLLVLI